MLLSKKYLNEQVQQKTINESTVFLDSKRTTLNAYDIFFSYSFNDKHFALLIVQLLEKQGFTVYIDLDDDRLKRDNVSRKTVERIANIMDKCKSLIYLHSKSSKVSKWCPWELGYMSGKKNFRCATIPLVDDNEMYEHQEYLKIYPYVEWNTITGKPKEYIFSVHEVTNWNIYTTLKHYVNGQQPTEHK